MKIIHKEKDNSSILPRITAIGLILTGIAGLVEGSGLGLIASALSFGVILVVSFY